ncbi:hypothetical protein [Streptomyces canus]|uniref:hypothetical protein n=1 Tax=Streptomyces canus TaxID=58343 RepID=UPI00035FCADB|nr:hypothetical protein [Streptomyces canus]
MKTERPPILYGAVALAVLSLAWSGYAITDLMHSGKFGLSVALAGDIGWITVLWAEYKGVTLAGRRWAPTLAGWLIAVGVALLLVIHGHQVGGRAQAVAGPFVVAVGKIVWAFALAAMKDTTAPTPEQQAEIDAVIRESSYKAQLHDARADAEIARIRAEARTTLARDDADFEVTLERIHKRAELNRRTPLALTAGSAEQPNNVIGEQGEQPPNAPSMLANKPSEHLANSPLNRPNADPDQPSIADLVREQIANHPNNADAIRGVMAARPDANKDSVAAAVRRERARTRSKGGYA